MPRAEGMDGDGDSAGGISTEDGCSSTLSFLFLRLRDPSLVARFPPRAFVPFSTDDEDEGSPASVTAAYCGAEGRISGTGSESAGAVVRFTTAASGAAGTDDAAGAEEAEETEGVEEAAGTAEAEEADGFVDAAGAEETAGADEAAGEGAGLDTGSEVLGRPAERGASFAVTGASVLRPAVEALGPPTDSVWTR